MDVIDRRSLIGAVGATMLIASCNKGTAEGTDTKATSDAEKMFGPCYPYGQPTTDLKPDATGNVSDFDPENICAVYIKFESNGTLTIKQAHIAVPKLKPTDSDIVAASAPLLNAMSKAAYNGNGAKKFKENFEDLTFSSQHVLVIFLDNKIDAVRFSEKDVDIIRFTPVSGNDPSIDINENHAFFDRRPVAINAGSGTSGRLAYLLNFWNTDDKGNKIANVTENDAATHYLYSMNIHLQMATSKRTAKLNWVPIVIDPDTGNGGAYP